MKQNSFLAMLICTTVLFGLPSCSNPDISTDTASPAAASQAEPEITVGGSGTAMRSLKLLAAAYASKTTAAPLNFLDSSQASAGIAGVKEGQLQIGTVTRSPKPEEVAAELEHREFAKDALLVATHPSVEGVTELSSDDLKAIYSGQETNWKAFGGPDADIVVLDRPEDESAKRLLRTHQLGDELPNAPTAVVLRKESELITAAQNTPFSIGAFSLANALSNEVPVNYLNINGVTPSVENITAGTYPMVRTLGIVWFGEPDASTQAFIDYVFSNQGAQVIENAGMSATSFDAT